MDNQLTDEQLIARGTQAERILSDEVLMGFLNEMRSDLLTCIGNTQPDDKTTRDTLYFEHRGLVALEAHLTAYRETARGIIERDALDQAAAKPDLETD